MSFPATSTMSSTMVRWTSKRRFPSIDWSRLKVFPQRCYEFYEPSFGGLDAPSTSRSYLFWIPTPTPPKVPHFAQDLSRIFSFCT